MRHQAFALREAIVLVAVVIIAGALLFPYFARSRETGYKTPNSTCQSNLKQMMLAVIMYSQDNNEKFPPAKISQAGVESTSNWAGILQSYLKSVYVFHCPLDKSDDHTPRSSYGYNQLLSQFPADKLHNPTFTISFFEVDSSLTPLTQTGSNVKDVSAASRHDNGANYAFADGHVKWLIPERVKGVRPDGENFTFAVE